MENKQIDEMTKDLCHTEACEIKKIGIPCNHRCKAHIYATRAIDKGYSKASELISEIDNALHDIAMEYYNAGRPEYFAVCEMIHHKVIAPFEKKYTEGKKDNGKV